MMENMCADYRNNTTRTDTRHVSIELISAPMCTCVSHKRTSRIARMKTFTQNPSTSSEVFDAKLVKLTKTSDITLKTISGHHKLANVATWSLNTLAGQAVWPSPAHPSLRNPRMIFVETFLAIWTSSASWRAEKPGWLVWLACLSFFSE